MIQEVVLHRDGLPSIRMAFPGQGPDTVHSRWTWRPSVRTRRVLSTSIIMFWLWLSYPICWLIGTIWGWVWPSGPSNLTIYPRTSPLLFCARLYAQWYT